MILRLRTEYDLSNEVIQSTLELDSHADTSCVGATFLILEYACNIRTLSEAHQELHDIQIVNAATAYDSSSGKTYILVINQALHLGDQMSHSLLCPTCLKNGLLKSMIPHMRYTFLRSKRYYPLSCRALFRPLPYGNPSTHASG